MARVYLLLIIGSDCWNVGKVGRVKVVFFNLVNDGQHWSMPLTVSSRWYDWRFLFFGQFGQLLGMV